MFPLAVEVFFFAVAWLQGVDGDRGGSGYATAVKSLLRRVSNYL